jgi:phosphatidylinositol-bisphosphatase
VCGLFSWCDRIQWIGEEVVQLCYKRCETLKISDHKPVMALFEIGAKEVINDKKRTVYESLIRQLDSWENQAIPKVEITPQSIDFGVVKFEEMRTQKLLIENTGAVTVVEFHFVPKVAGGIDANSATANSKTLPSINTSGPKWLKVMPEFGIIPPHESIEITISMHVTSECSHAIQTGAQALEDILILTLENGRDYFLPVQGEYQRSCLGTTIEYLVNVRTQDTQRSGAPFLC